MLLFLLRVPYVLLLILDVHYFFFISVIDGYNALIGSVPAFEVGILTKIADVYATYLPLYSIGLGWIVPAVVGTVIGLLIPSKK